MVMSVILIMEVHLAGLLLLADMHGNNCCCAQMLARPSIFQSLCVLNLEDQVCPADSVVATSVIILSTTAYSARMTMGLPDTDTLPS
jgi:hypothetical protein